MSFARRPKLWFAPSSSGVTRGLGFLVAFTSAAFFSSCLLNPQPHPPGDDDDPPPAGAGRAGFAGAGGAGGAGAVGGAGTVGGSAGTGGGINIDAGAGSGGGSGRGSGGAGGAGGSSGGNAGPCRAARDCSLDSACFADDGTCARVPMPDCLPPANEGGSNLRLSVCSAASPCSEGLTCVPLAQVLGSTGAYQAGPSGVCLTACNPCAPMQCSLGETCFARAPGRSFCALSLVAEGAPCGYAVTPAPCAAGLTCAEVFEQAGRTCVPHCRPEGAPDLSSHDDYSASPSSDCAPGKVCFETASSSQAAAATDFACVTGTLVDVAGACGGDRFCKPPGRCVAGVCMP